MSKLLFHRKKSICYKVFHRHINKTDKTHIILWTVDCKAFGVFRLIMFAVLNILVILHDCLINSTNVISALTMG